MKTDGYFGLSISRGKASYCDYLKKRIEHISYLQYYIAEPDDEVWILLYPGRQPAVIELVGSAKGSAGITVDTPSSAWLIEAMNLSPMKVPNRIDMKAKDFFYEYSKILHKELYKDIRSFGSLTECSSC